MKKFLLLILSIFAIWLTFAVDNNSKCYWKNNNYYCATKICAKNKKCNIKYIKAKPPVFKSIQTTWIVNTWNIYISNTTIIWSITWVVDGWVIRTWEIITGSVKNENWVIDIVKQKLKEYNDSQKESSPTTIPIFVQKIVKWTELPKEVWSISIYSKPTTTTTAYVPLNSYNSTTAINWWNSNCSYDTKVCITWPRWWRYYINCHWDKIYDC